MWFMPHDWPSRCTWRWQTCHPNNNSLASVDSRFFQGCFCLLAGEIFSLGFLFIFCQIGQWYDIQMHIYIYTFIRIYILYIIIYRERGRGLISNYTHTHTRTYKRNTHTHTYNNSSAESVCVYAWTTWIIDPHFSLWSPCILAGFTSKLPILFSNSKKEIQSFSGKMLHI